MTSLLAKPDEATIVAPPEVGSPLAFATAAVFKDIAAAAAVDSLSYLLRNLFDKIVPPTDIEAIAAATSVVNRLSSLEKEVEVLKKSTVRLF